MISPGIIFDNTNNYGIVKTETVIGFGPKHRNLLNMNSTEPFEWLFSHSFGRSLADLPSAEVQHRAYKNKEPPQGKSKKKHSKHKLKQKKCIYKLLKRKKKRKKHFLKKYMMPMIVGILVAKSVLIPVALKFIALISLKGFKMGIFSTIMTSILGVNAMFNLYGHHQRKDDTNTKVEIIHKPDNEYHHYYEDPSRSNLVDSKIF